MNLNKYKKDNYIPVPFSNNKIINIKINYRIIFIIIIFTFFILSLFYVKNQRKNISNNLLSKKSIKDNNENLFLLKLKSILDREEIYENEMMNKHTTFKLGGPAKYFVIPKSINKIIKIIQLCNEFSVEYFILGNGSNLLVSDHGYDGLIININENNFSDMKVMKFNESNYYITVGGGILMRNLAQKLCLLSLTGLEDMVDIPGTIGGGIIMNANSGTKGLIKDSLYKVKVITPLAEIKELSKEDCKLRDRGSLLKDNKYMVIEATFILKKGDKMIIQKTMADHISRRYAHQPVFFPSAGSFFLWKKSIFGSLYEKYKDNNLVGYRVGDAMIYPLNIAFIVNLGNAKSSDVYEIVKVVEKMMKQKYNIDIKKEVVIIGNFQ
jgi:UDP-N-acetylmuramate dehydrogenase